VQKTEKELRAAYFEQLKLKLTDGENQKVTKILWNKIIKQ
jgi:hypothetical protein